MKLAARAGIAALSLSLSACGNASSEPQAGAGAETSDAGGSSGASGGVSASNGGSAGPSALGGGAGSGTTAGATGGGGITSVGSAGAAGSSDDDFCSARAGLSFCESFETLEVGPAMANATWTPSVNGDGTLTIDDQVAHAGKRALKVHGSGFSTFYVLAGEALGPPGPHYVRAFIRLSEAMTAGHNTLMVADLNAAPGAGNAFRLGEMNAMLMYTVSGDTHGALANDNYYTDHLPGAALTPLAWSCLEVKLDPQAPEVAVWLDGVEIADLHHTDWPLDAYDALRFGFEKYAGPVGDIWYDDIAVGTVALGCD